MKKSIPCNNTHYTNKKNQNRIIYDFVSEDKLTASSCIVRIGDRDPLTGEAIKDMAFYLKEYYKLDSHQVYKNLENIRIPFTEKQKEERERLKQKYIQEFEQDYGYHPSKDDIRYYLEQKMPEIYHQHIEANRQQDEEPLDEFGEEFQSYDEDPFGCDLPDDLYALREIVENLPDRLKPVYEAMLQQAAGGADRITLTDVSHEKGVSYNQIMKDTKTIIKTIREKVGIYY